VAKNLQLKLNLNVRNIYIMAHCQSIKLPKWQFDQMLSCQNEEASELLCASKKKFLMLKISFLSSVLARRRQADEPPGVIFIKLFSFVTDDEA
jgi:hypothetical protein